MKPIVSQQKRYIEIALHVLTWTIIFTYPLLFIDRSNDYFTWWNYLRHSMVPLSFMIAFYANYFILIPRFLFQDQTRKYIVLNVVLFGVLLASLQFWQAVTTPVLPPGEVIKPGKHHPHRIMFIMRDFIGMAFTVGVSAIICMSKRWSVTENARKEAEKSRTEAELKNLRNQLNPHFLLNTLNNIYALTAFDTEKAQQTIQELSKLLRYMLYDNQQDYVPLGKEVDFIRNYIELMRIRLSSNITLETHLDVSSENQTRITPLIFISLIENAFKHGISPDKPSFVYIALSEENGNIVCEIRNSNYPKTDHDKSGSGIGLAQVHKRLELLYPDNYVWEKGVTDDGREYISKLIIRTNK